MKSIFLTSILLVGLLAGCTKSEVTPTESKMNSTGTRGGGDPDAVAFLYFANQIGKWLVTQSLTETTSKIQAAEANSFVEITHRLAKEMDRESGPPLVFVTEDLKDSSGAPKKAIFQRDPLLIQVNRAYWNEAQIFDRYTLVALEIFGIMGLEGRYDLAEIVTKNYMEIAETQQADQPYLTMSGVIFHKLGEMKDRAPLIVMTTGIIRPTDQWLTGWKLEKYESQRAEDYQELASGFTNLPDLYQMDVLVSRIAVYRIPSIGSNGWSGFLNWDFKPVSEQVAEEVREYLFRSLNMLKDFSKKTDQLSVAQIKSIQEMGKETEALFKFFDNSVTKDNVTYVDPTSPTKAYHEALVTSMRQEIQKRKCRVPSTYKPEFSDGALKHSQDLIEESANLPTPDLNLLGKQTEELSDQIARRMSALATNFCNFSMTENLDKVDFDSIHGIESGTRTCNLYRIAYKFHATYRNIRYDGETKKFKAILDRLRKGELCAR